MPEEINRLLTDHLSTLLFCPTTQSVGNLLKEGIKDEQGRIVKKVGDVMYDSILYYSKIAEKKSTILKDLDLSAPNSCTERFRTVPYPTRNYYLVTLHRAENTDDAKRLKSILKGVKKLGEDTRVIFPLHPRTKKMLETYHLAGEVKVVKLINPVSYLDMLTLEKNAKAILTDSGGVQKEAYWFRVPCFTLRKETEWVETIQSRWNVLVDTETEQIAEEVKKRGGGRRPSKETKLFGDGKASEKIVQILSERFFKKD
jgi:UDP-N-acetylglucosamine 2-epimerase